MKKRVAFAMVIIVGLLCALPATGYSWRPYGPPPYYGGGCYGGCGNGWGFGAAIAGGLLAGVIVGAVITDQARRAESPPRYYVAPGDPRVAYAYPDPAFIEKYGSKKAPAESLSGGWVTVPGQSVDGVWVPEHKVWLEGTSPK
jgi:hypothetical protein